MVARVLVLLYDEPVAFFERELAQGWERAGLVDVEYGVEEVEECGVRCVEVHGANIVALCRPVDAIVVLGIEFLTAGSDEVKEFTCFTYLTKGKNQIVLFHLPPESIEVRHGYVNSAAMNPPSVRMERCHVWKHPCRRGQICDRMKT